jgi:hypothetical protein
VCSATDAGVDRVRGRRRDGVEGASEGGWCKMDIKLTELDATVGGAYDLIIDVGGTGESLRVEIFFAGGLSQLSRLP